MSNTVTLMEQDGNSPVLFWTTKLVGAGHADGTVSLWVVEESAFGRVTHQVATRSSSAREIVAAMTSGADWSDLEIGYDAIVATIGPRLASVAGTMAAAISQDAWLLMQGETAPRKAA